MMEIIEKIKNKKACICVIGLGYVGLPLLKAFLYSGLRVIGFDVDKNKVAMLNQGKSYIKHISNDDLKPFLDNQKLYATTNESKLKEADAILICVPTPLDAHKNPDLSFVLDTARVIARNLKKGQLIVLESTTYPGTTEEEILPILENKELKVGKDYFLAYSPERENPGDKLFTTADIPKVVGGVTPACRNAACALYDEIVIKTVPVSSPSIAEASKLLENIFRSVNIALVNELKMIFDRMGIDIWEVIRSSATKPFGFMSFSPGPGLGGHCIPIDPFYLSWKAKEYDYPTRFIELAGEINAYMPYYVVLRTIDALNERGKTIKNSKVLILGIAYKKDIDDQRETPSLKIISLLRKRGARVSYNDPYIPKMPDYRDYPEIKMESVQLSADVIQKYDAVIIVTDHSLYDFDWVVKNSFLVIDTRNAVKKKYENVVKA